MNRSWRRNALLAAAVHVLAPAALCCGTLLYSCGNSTPASDSSPAEPLERARVRTDRAGVDAIRSALGGLPSTRIEQKPSSPLFTLHLTRAELTRASQAMHSTLNRCGGFILDGYGGVKTEPPAQFPGAFVPPLPPLDQARSLSSPYAIDNGVTVDALLKSLQESNLLSTIQELAAMPTRFHESESGLQASLWMRDRFQKHVGVRTDVSVELIDHVKTPQQSVSLTIRGARYPDELVILGGHLDSINIQGGNAPGADDNASGIAVLDEVARVALELGYVPDRTVTFYAYAAEEVGLIGSSEIAAALARKKTNVVAILQLDMTNYSAAAQPYFGIVTDFTDDRLNQFAEQLIDQYVGVPWKLTRCGYACSDHAAWNQAGFPVHFVHESTTNESNTKIHTADDTLALSRGSVSHSMHFAKYAAAFMAEAAKGQLGFRRCDPANTCLSGEECQFGHCAPSIAGSAGTSGLAVGGSTGGPGSRISDTSGAPGMSPVSAQGGASGVAGTAPVRDLAASRNEAGGACGTAPGGRRSAWAVALGLSALAAHRRRRRGARKVPNGT